MADKKTKKGRSGLPTQMGLTFRIIAGAYLMYLAYSIYTGSGEIVGAEKIAFIGAIVIFVAVGAYIIVTSLRAMQRGEYEGGAADHRKDAEEEEADENVKTSVTDRIRFGEEETLPEKKEEER